MAEKKDTHEFAAKYHSIYVNPKTTEDEVEKGFGDQHFPFGFETDCGNRFTGTFTAGFEGTLQKIQLISNNVCYGPCPKPEDEIKQHLTITADGRVWLSRYRFGAVGSEPELFETQNFNISTEATNRIMTEVARYFGDEYDINLVTDVGSWNLVLTNTEGKIYKISGALCHDLQTVSGGLSDLIRTNLDRNDLLVFDGNPDSVVRIEIKYHRNTKIKPGAIPEEATWDYVTWDYNESLTLDRSSETLEHIREIGSGCKVTNIYYIQGASCIL